MAASFKGNSSTKKLFDLIDRVDEPVEESIQTLLQEGADLDINAREPIGYTPLLLACALFRPSVVELLIDSGANVDLKCAKKGWTVLHYASKCGWNDIVRSLVQKMSSLDAVDKEGKTALYLACCTDVPQVIASWNDLRMTPIASSFPRQLELVKCLVENGANVHLKCTSDGLTPLLCAAQHSKRDIVDFLLASGATDDEGMLLYYASSHGWTDIVRALIKRIPKHLSDTEAALHEAAREGYLEIVKCLVEAGANLNSMTVVNWRTLVCASRSGRLGQVKWLVQQALDISPIRFNFELMRLQLSPRSQMDRIKVFHRNCYNNAMDGCGITAFAIACVRRQFQVDIDATDRCGMTALGSACLHRQYQVAQYLLRAGASWKIHGDIPCSLKWHDCNTLNIITGGPKPDFEFIKLFIENGAYFNIHDYKNLMKDSSLEVLRNVELCCKIIANQFNNFHLTEIYKLFESVGLPCIEKMKIGSGSEMAQSIKRAVEFDIQTNGHCKVLEVRPMVLSLISARSLLKYYDKWLTVIYNEVKQKYAMR